MMAVVVVMVLVIEMAAVAVGLHVRQYGLGGDLRQLWPPPPRR